jgi:hypothetical protein
MSPPIAATGSGPPAPAAALAPPRRPRNEQHQRHACLTDWHDLQEQQHHGDQVQSAQANGQGSAPRDLNRPVGYLPSKSIEIDN